MQSKKHRLDLLNFEYPWAKIQQHRQSLPPAKSPKDHAPYFPSTCASVVLVSDSLHIRSRTRRNNWNCPQISSTVTTFHFHRFAISIYFIRLTPYLSRVFEFSFFWGLTVEYGGIGQSYLFEFIERMCPRRTYKINRSNSRELHTYRPFDEKEIALIHHERHLDSSIGDCQVVTSESKKSSR